MLAHQSTPEPSPHHLRPTSPPSKASLKAWWNHFTFVQRTKKESAFVREFEKGSDHPVFGKPLAETLRYASVPISTANQSGDLYVWGYVPIVVAKCGLHLKENATEIQGIFRVNGSNKRMRELQFHFETPPKYGKNLDWKQEVYTAHDVASVFRRYLTQMPEPVIPYKLYHSFRDALSKDPHNRDAVIAQYKSLIRQMPPANQYLLLYVLDLLSVFARKSDKNLMTATNLAVIFRPAILSHPSHEMAPSEHELSQRVLEFLIANQDWFMLDTPTPNLSAIIPSTRPISPSSPPSAFNHLQLPNPYGSSSSPPSTSAVHWRVDTNNGDNAMMTEKEIRSEQERIKMMRRRTTMERGELGTYGTLEEPDMSGGDSPTSPSNTVTVARSRTLPSSRRRRGDLGEAGSNSDVNDRVHPIEKPERSRLSKKQKRSSVNPASRPLTPSLQRPEPLRSSQVVPGHGQA